jgi:hypothetical protein
VQLAQLVRKDPLVQLVQRQQFRDQLVLLVLVIQMLHLAHQHLLVPAQKYLQ